MIKFFNQQWDEVPLVVVDTETTGKQPGKDRTVQVGIVRFEMGLPVASVTSEINPGMPIPAEVTAIHGVNDEMVAGAPTLAEFFARPSTVEILSGAQPCAYHASFDKFFVPPFQEDHSWPWADALSLVRKVDKWTPGKGRHRLEAACARHGVELTQAHNAGADALACGQLFYKLGRATFPKVYTMGRLLIWQRRQEAEQWADHVTWRANLPPQESAQ